MLLRRRRNYSPAALSSYNLSTFSARDNEMEGSFIRQVVSSSISNQTLVPTLPNAYLLERLPVRENTVRFNRENTVSVTSLPRDERVALWSKVLPSDYGNENGIGTQRGATRRNTVRLSKEERKVYLQLLPTVPVRVRQQAILLARAAGNDADDLRQARRIAQWVENAATYTLRPPNLPDERDATDFFLFDSRRGYCTHFAGALAVMCRAAGIPSRVATGFANLEREGGSNDNGSHQVARSANAHAWTEIWQDGLGWIPLDATPPDDRGDNAPTVWQDISDRIGSAIANLWISMQAHRMLWIGGAALAVTLMLTAFGVNRRVRERNRAWALARKVWSQRLRGNRRAGESAGEVNVLEQNDLAARATIFTFSNKAARQLTRRFRARREGQTPHDWLQEAETALPQFDLAAMRTLVELQRRAMYNPQYMTAQDGEEARAAFKRLSWKKRAVEPQKS
jgi:transglutaminase-like putative cysteine protease